MTVCIVFKFLHPLLSLRRLPTDGAFMSKAFCYLGDDPCCSVGERNMRQMFRYFKFDVSPSFNLVMVAERSEPTEVVPVPFWFRA